MMFNKQFSVILIAFFVLCSSMKVLAADEELIPQGEILLIYSDGADDETMDAVNRIIEHLTYQSFQVSFGSATECAGAVSDFSHIICYNIKSYPKALRENLYEREDAKADILFIGSGFLRKYLDESGRENLYTIAADPIGELTYPFTSMDSKDSLIQEPYYLFLKNTEDYSSGRVQVGKKDGYFCGRNGQITHITATDLGNPIVEAAISKELAQWKWPYKGEPHIYAQYMLIDQVYPYQDPNKLLDVVNLLVNQKEPFVISVMPIYTNGDYPAMQHFCEVLRYAQANGGTVIMHAPINQMVPFKKDTMLEYMTLSLQNYMKQGVYPMALQVPKNWMFSSDTVEVMSHFRTIVTTDETDLQIEADKNLHTNMVYKDGHQWISPAISIDDYGISYTRVASTTVPLNLEDSMDVIEAKIKACQQSAVPLKSLWDIEHSFWTSEDIMNYKNHIILVNNKRVENYFEKTDYVENYRYNRNILKRFSKDLASENKKLVVAVCIVAVLFSGFILIARHNNKKKYFERDKKKKEM